MLRTIIIIIIITAQSGIQSKDITYKVYSITGPLQRSILAPYYIATC